MFRGAISYVFMTYGCLSDIRYFSTIYQNLTGRGPAGVWTLVSFDRWLVYTRSHELLRIREVGGVVVWYITGSGRHLKTCR